MLDPSLSEQARKWADEIEGRVDVHPKADLLRALADEN